MNRHDKEIIYHLLMMECSYGEIADFLGISPGKAYYYAKPIKDWIDKYKGKNADRHLCRHCTYRLYAHSPGGVCNYISVTGKMRGCKPEDCDKYKPRRGGRKKYER